MCGEQCLELANLAGIPGSPPRVRGTGNIFHKACILHRITPACAGNRKPAADLKKIMQDHPRVCGEQPSSVPASYPRPGSPPRVRGTVAYQRIIAYQNRITPACAGNRSMQITTSITLEDHPRVCGEQNVKTNSAEWAEGSPPRVRGTGRVRRPPVSAVGITPACAGNRGQAGPFVVR